MTQEPSEITNMTYIACHVKKFYPLNIRLSWLENGIVSRVEEPSIFTLNKDGTYSWTTWLLVKVSAQEKDQEVHCQVDHDGDPPVTKTHVVLPNEQQNDEDDDDKISDQYHTVPGCY